MRKVPNAASCSSVWDVRACSRRHGLQRETPTGKGATLACADQSPFDHPNYEAKQVTMLRDATRDLIAGQRGRFEHNANRYIAEERIEDRPGNFAGDQLLPPAQRHDLFSFAGDLPLAQGILPP